ncbi:MAG TPA: DUF3822 family protein [Chitinophagaceae bacterium]|nr:DUF3822 family protein [Chitinophagaceae bacterium]
MLQKTFGIYSDNLEKCTLFIEAGNRHIACWCKEPETGKVTAFEFFQFDEEDAGNIDEIVHNVRIQSQLADAVISVQPIIWEGSALYVPGVFYQEDLCQAYLDTMMGDDAEAQVFNWRADEHVIIARQTPAYVNAIHQHFKDVSNNHKFLLLLKDYFGRTQPGGEAAAVYLVFYPAHFILTAIKNNTLQIITSINYSTSEDVLYSVMQVCRQCNIALESTPIIASGLIDTASNLYTTLYSYLENFSLEETSAAVFGDGFSEYPAHYFLPFITE